MGFLPHIFYRLLYTINLSLYLTTRRRICKSLVRRNYQSFAKKCVQNVVGRKALVKIVGRTLTKEVAAMCSKKFNSLLRAKDNESMLKFKFGTDE